MNKDIKRLFILILFLIVISVVVILVRGNTYQLSFENVKGNYTLNIDNESGEIELLEQKEKDGNFFLKVKSKKPGQVFISLNYDDYTDMKNLYIHKSGIITDNNYFGKSTGCEVVPISISIVLIYLLYILIRRYKSSVKENLYQYKNVAYLGMIIFLLVFALTNIFSIFNYQGLYDTVSQIISSMGGFSIIIFPLAVITFILVTISNIRLIKKEGMSLRNLLGLFLGIAICLLTLLPDKMYKILQQSQKLNIYNLNGPGPYIYDFIESLIYLGIAYLECILISTIIVALKAAKRKIKYNKDYMIVLGCQIKKDGTLTPLLKGRVDKALEFRNKQLEETGKDLVFIGSGGKGSDEPISEGEAIKNYLIEQGIDKKNVLVDDKSTNTYENIMYSNKLIKKKNTNVAFSTTNYHVFRAGLLATEQGLLLEGVGGKTKAYFWINAFIREFIGTLYSEKKKHIMVLLSIIVMLIVMIIITYFANNI